MPLQYLSKRRDIYVFTLSEKLFYFSEKNDSWFSISSIVKMRDFRNIAIESIAKEVYFAAEDESISI